MFDETNPELNATNQQQEQTQEPTQNVSSRETEREYNLRILADRAKRAEERAAELERYVHEQQKRNQPAHESTESDIDLDDDSYIEGKHFKKYVRSLKEEIKQAKDQLKEFTQQTSTSSAEFRLKAKYNDFDNVVTKENIEKLASMKPAHYRSIMANPDLYDKGEAAYDLIKNFITDEYAEQDKRIADNKAKPRSGASAPSSQSDTPLSRIGDYDRRVLSSSDRDRIMRMVKEAKRNG